MGAETPLIQCVAVLYGAGAAQSETLRALGQIGEARPELARRFALLLYDNSPETHAVRDQVSGFADVEYVHNPANPGLAEAYRTALARAQATGLKWLLLLDQDTVVSAALLDELVGRVSGSLPAAVGSMVPKLVRDDAVLSPEIEGGMRNRAVDAAACGMREERMTALNAGSCLRVEALQQIGGFPAGFPLDYLDHAVYAELHRAGWRVWVLDSAIEHGLSLARMEEEEMPPARYVRVLAAEWCYVRRYGGNRMQHRVRLLKRGAVQAVRFRKKSFAWATLRAAIAG